MSSGPITRKRLLLGLGILFNFLLPWAIFRLTKPHVGETHAIIISAVVPAVWSLVQFARNRNVDAMSAIVLAGIGLSLAVLALGGSPKILLFRESLITGLGGLVLIGSAMIRRPLMFVLFRAVMSRQVLDTVAPRSIAERAHAQLESYVGKLWYRRIMAVMTIAVGLVLVAETAVLSVLIFSLPTERVLLIRPIVRYGAAGLILLWTFLFFVPAVRRGAREDERTEALTDEQNLLQNG